jgi:predicted nucleotidyltransferase
MPSEPDVEHPFSSLEASLKKAVAALREADVSFLLAGSLAVWARGGPETHHDLDFVLREEEAGRALEVLADAGMRPEKPPEEWLYKAWDDDVLVDLIFHPSGIRPDDAVIERGETLNVMGMELPVMALEDVIATKLNALTEHSLRYEGVLEMARALREQVDWDQVRERSAGNPFADAYFLLLDRLEILPEGRPEPRVRVDVKTA